MDASSVSVISSTADLVDGLCNATGAFTTAETEAAPERPRSAAISVDCKFCSDDLFAAAVVVVVVDDGVVTALVVVCCATSAPVPVPVPAAATTAGREGGGGCDGVAADSNTVCVMGNGNSPSSFF